MTAPRTSEPLSHTSEECISEVRRLASAHVPELKHEQSGQGSEEWNDRLRALEQWICELLIENQRLRMLFGEETMLVPGRNDGHSP
jgi:coenzyme F420-reducing hydrogenase delta subunit